MNLSILASTLCGALAVWPAAVHAGGGSCGSQPESARVSMAVAGAADIVESAVAAGSFKTLVRALEAANLVAALQGDGPFTVFAPTDEAFAKLPEGTLAGLLQPDNRALLAAILTYHVVPGRLTAADVEARTGAETLNGQRIAFTVRGGVKVDDAAVIKADIECSNGVIHVIDRVIMPGTDGIIDAAVRAGSFSTLVSAIKAAGLAATLSGDGPFTVLAPNDEAFAKLPSGTLESLLVPSGRDQLARILKAHVIAGRVYAADALQAQTAPTLEGMRVRFTIRGGAVMVNDAGVLEADVQARNGVIHVIDRVLMP